MMSFDGQHAIITGGGSGIGAAVARRLAGGGARVTIVGRTLQKLEKVAIENAGISVQAGDVTDRASLDKAFDAAVAQHGRVSIVVANAGSASSAPFRKLDAAAWQHDLDVNLTGVFNTFQCALGHMNDGTGGRLVAVASTAGMKGYPYVSAYCAAKHGVIGLVRALALELAESGITVNAVCPGFTDTPMLGADLDNIIAKTKMSREEAEKSLLKATPIGRFTTPDEVAATVQWLCSKETGAVTGEAISVAGGER
jgi:NAD(P)-dependent dehydrogenase (short-subunit alcohol dehydrogenase family)